MSNNKSFIQTILTQIRGKINQYVFDRMVANGSFDADVAIWEIKTRKYETLGEYVGQGFFQKLFAPRAL